ncbi:MAG TPA: AI-2E family transporter [Streptosporangiaceae bacterium]|nr:AI-2E family transporter [Streptosporangiaceae bacterium]
MLRRAGYPEPGRTGRERGRAGRAGKQRLQKLVSAKGTTLISGLLGAGKVVLGALGSVLVVSVLTGSLPVAVATLGFYVGYRLAEDYLLVPRIMGRAVQVPAVVSVLAMLVGGALLGIIGALVAIPTAAALRLWLDEVAFCRLDNG